MVLDIHHHICNNNGEKLDELLKKIIDTWENEYYPVKMHFSYPKNGEKDRKHSDYINAPDFINFIEKCRSINKDIDIMIEAKKKDLAMFKLRDDIKLLKKEWKWIDNTTLGINDY